MKGLIKKGIGGFYYVRTAEGEIRAKGRGIFRNEDITLTVGDQVDVEKREDGDGVIRRIYPRHNLFQRPPIANVDLIVIVFAAAQPSPNFDLIDRFLIMAEAKGVQAALCMNKADLLDEAQCEEMLEPYRGIYPHFTTCAAKEELPPGLVQMIRGRKVAFAGPSGVGKSTLINRLIPGAGMETSEISKKTKRGKHTTRHVEILDVPGGGMVFDTPGFTSFDIKDVEEAELWRYYPDIAACSGGCRFDDCVHISEPDCTVQKAVREGRIHPKRYASYVKNYREIKENNRRNHG